MRTLIKGGDIIGFDGERHRLIFGADLSIENDRVTAIGAASGHYDREIDATGKFVLPGFVNLHTHTGSTVATRLVTERSFPALMNAAYLGFSPKEDAPRNVGSHEDAAIGGRATIVELLKAGTTTVVDLGQGCDYDQMVDQFGELGMRAYLSPGVRSGYHVFDSKGLIKIKWLEDEGLGALRSAVDFIQRHDGAYDGRIRGMLFPYQGDTCTDTLLKEARAAAERLGVRMQMHAAQSIFELHEMLRRHGKTTIQHFADIGFLGPDLIISHCPYITGHPATAMTGDEDLNLLAKHGVHVCHNPTTQFRRGHVLRSFSRYRAAGVNIGIGTDHYPRDMVYEMRLAALMGKVAEGDPDSMTTMDAFNAATIGSADAIGRPDLGRLFPGSKADVLIVDLKRIGAVPLRDPVQDLVLTGVPSDIKMVLIDGKVVCEDGKVPGVDEADLVDKLQASAETIFGDVPTWHWAGWNVDQFAPRFLEPMAEYTFTPKA